jgi:hypothetical protein
MTPLRRKRLLLLAQVPNPLHQRYYSQYCTLLGEGLVMWTMGMAFLTDEGVLKLEELTDGKK